MLVPFDDDAPIQKHNNKHKEKKLQLYKDDNRLHALALCKLHQLHLVAHPPHPNLGPRAASSVRWLLDRCTIPVDDGHFTHGSLTVYIAHSTKTMFTFNQAMKHPQKHTMEARVLLQGGRAFVSKKAVENKAITFVSTPGTLLEEVPLGMGHSKKAVLETLGKTFAKTVSISQHQATEIIKMVPHWDAYIPAVTEPNQNYNDLWKQLKQGGSIDIPPQYRTKFKAAVVGAVQRNFPNLIVDKTIEYSSSAFYSEKTRILV